jgi:hypothetical protein
METTTNTKTPAGVPLFRLPTKPARRGEERLHSEERLARFLADGERRILFSLVGGTLCLVVAAILILAR